MNIRIATPSLRLVSVTKVAAVLTYGDLTRLDPQTVTPQQVFDAVCHMRMTKLLIQR
jgi:UDP-N-acetylmuramate dehydrogenase